MNIQNVLHKNLTFVNVNNAGEFEIKYLAKNYGFDSLHLEDYLSHIQVPKIEKFKNYYLFVLDIPISNDSTSKNNDDKNLYQKIQSIPNRSKNTKPSRLHPSHVNIFIGDDYLVVLHENIPIIESIFSHCQQKLANRDKYMGRGPIYLAYQLIDELIDSCFPVINELYTVIDNIDKDIEMEKTDSTLEKISLTRRNIVVFHTMIKPILLIFKNMDEEKHSMLIKDLGPYWKNILDHLQKIINRLDDSRELIEGISESHESYLTQKTNEIIKVLTIFSAILLPLNLIASIYGMNLAWLPLANDSMSFLWITYIMFIIGLVSLLVFKLRKWF